MPLTCKTDGKLGAVKHSQEFLPTVKPERCQLQFHDIRIEFRMRIRYDPLECVKSTFVIMEIAPSVADQVIKTNVFDSFRSRHHRTFFRLIELTGRLLAAADIIEFTVIDKHLG